MSESKWALVTELPVTREWVTSVAWSPDGSRLLTGSSDRRARLWDVNSGSFVKEFMDLEFMGSAGVRQSVAWSPDGSQIATGTRALRVWDVATGECVREVDACFDEVPLLKRISQADNLSVRSISWSPDGSRIATGSMALRVWDAHPGWAPVAELSAPGEHSGLVAWSPDGTRLLSGGTEGNTVQVWDAAAGVRVAELSVHTRYRELTGHNPPVDSVVWSPDSSQLASGGADDTVRIWDVESGACIANWRHDAKPANDYYSDSIQAVGWSSDGMLLATGSTSGTIRVWDAATHHCVEELPSHCNWVSSLAWSPDGLLLASASLDGTVRVWERPSNLAP